MTTKYTVFFKQEAKDDLHRSTTLLQEFLVLQKLFFFINATEQLENTFWFTSNFFWFNVIDNTPHQENLC